MQYFSKRFTMNHIIPSVQLPTKIQVLFNDKDMKVKMVMNKSKVKGKKNGGAMITTNWKELVKLYDMTVNDIFVFFFGRDLNDGEFKIALYRL